MNKPVLLVAEDNDLDAMLLERMLERCGSIFQIARARNGLEAVDYLRGVGEFADRTKHPAAALVLLDLKMPRLDGFGVLRWRRETPSFVGVPVIVFSSSNLPEDVAQAYALGANSYVAKPSDPLRLERVIKALNEWWAMLNLTPPRP